MRDQEENDVGATLLKQSENDFKVKLKENRMNLDLAHSNKTQKHASLEDRIMRLEDIESIRRLKARYCEICDAGHDPDQMVELFADDGTWESVGGGYGVYHGRDQIRDAFAVFRDKITFSQHNVTNPVIDVAPDGVSATGTWHFTGLLKHGEKAVWGLARYDEKYVKVKGIWKIFHLRATKLAALPAPELSI